MRRRTAAGRPLAVLGAALLVAACASTPILANAPVVRPSPPATPSPTPLPSDPIAISFPGDDGPHHRLMEWWYYTGHLRDASGRRFGFEFVVFRAERGDFPVSWASHLAITAESADRFAYGQRSEIGGHVDRSPRSAAATPTGFDLALTGADPTDPATLGRPVWQMAGSNGRDRLTAALAADEAAAAGVPGGLGIDLALATDRPPALHDRDGWIDFGSAGGSYYYSRTRMAATGSVTFDGLTSNVTGTAWFDHQWGDFISVGGGWDWFALNLDDGTDVTLSLVRSPDGSLPLVYGTLVAPNGTTRHLARSDFSVRSTGSWTSARTAAVYPAGWLVDLPERRLTLELAPTVAAQELDTRATSGVVYWEGSQRVSGTLAGRPIGGEAYVELTGYSQGR
ncbi:MAG TPA: lipocalin family protein [Candidatus Limnocylindrales bacterium]